MTDDLSMNDVMRELAFKGTPVEQKAQPTAAPKIILDDERRAYVKQSTQTLATPAPNAVQPKGKTIPAPVEQPAEQSEFNLESIFTKEFLALLTPEDLELQLKDIILKNRVPAGPEPLTWNQHSSGDLWQEVTFGTKQGLAAFLTNCFGLVGSYYPTGELSLEVYIDPGEEAETKCSQVSDLYVDIKKQLEGQVKLDHQAIDTQSCAYTDEIVQKFQVEKNFLLKVPIAKIGQWKHPKYGLVQFTSDDLDSILSNFKSNELGFDIPLYLGHSDGDGKPAEGFLFHMERLDDILFGFWKVNKKTYRMVEDDNYRYSSAELLTNFTSKKTGEEVGKTLFGMALTNIPFVPDLPRIQALEDANIENNVIYMSFGKAKSEPKTEQKTYSNPIDNTFKMENQISAVEAALRKEVSNITAKIKELEKEKVELSTAKAQEEITELKSQVEQYSQKESTYNEAEQKLTQAMAQNKELADMVEGYQKDLRNQNVAMKVEKLNKLSLPTDFKETFTNLIKEDKLGEAEDIIVGSLEKLSGAFVNEVTTQAGTTEATANLNSEQYEDPFAAEQERCRKLIEQRKAGR